MKYDIEITKEKTNDVLKEIEEAFYDIPFGNSGFQTEMFVIAAQITPERMYRQLGLEMHSRLMNLKENQFNQMKRQVELDKLKQKLNDQNIDIFERKLTEIQIAEIESYVFWDMKLINDQIVQLNILYKHFKEMPKLTREQFENGEQIHFEQKLRRQILGLTGAKESILNMIDDKKTIEMFKEMCASISNEDQLNFINKIARDSLAGYISHDGEKT